MQRLSIIRVPGDPDKLLAAKREHIDPVVQRKAGENGHILHIAAKGPDGMVVVNLWESEQGSEDAFNDPEIVAAREKAAEAASPTGPPEFTHYEVVDFRQT